jgi:exonuclease III
MSLDVVEISGDDSIIVEIDNSLPRTHPISSASIIFHTRSHYYGIGIVLNKRLLPRSAIDFVVDSNQFVVAFDIYKKTRVIGVYLPHKKRNGKEIKWYSNIFESIIKKHCLSNKPTIIVGDFNARNKNWNPEEKITNELGTWLYDRMLRIGMHRVVPSIGTWTFENHAGRSTIDHVFANNSNIHLMIDKDFTGSDHKPLILSIKCKL